MIAAPLTVAGPLFWKAIVYCSVSPGAAVGLFGLTTFWIDRLSGGGGTVTMVVTGLLGCAYCSAATVICAWLVIGVWSGVLELTWTWKATEPFWPGPSGGRFQVRTPPIGVMPWEVASNWVLAGI